MKHLTTKSARKVAKNQAKEAKIAGKAGSPTKKQMDTFTGALNIAGKKLKKEAVMKKANRYSTRDRMRDNRTQNKIDSKYKKSVKGK